MSPDRSVSVVIPTYGKLGCLRATLESLAAQSYPADLTEVVVVDDCSDDGTSAFLEGLEASYSLVALRHDTNRGRAAARNTAIEAAGGELVVFVDDDMRCEPDLIERHVECQTAHGDCVTIGSAVTAPELGRSTVYAYLDEMGVHRLAAGSRAPARYFVTNNSSVPRRCLIEAGLFDESFRNYGFEDAELGFRLEDVAGMEFWFCDRAVSYHVHAQTLDQVLDKRFDTALPLTLLLERHPNRAKELSVDVLLPPSPDDPPGLRFRKLAVLLITNPLFYAVARGLARGVWLGPLSCRTMMFLIACQYRRGLREVASRGPA